MVKLGVRRFATGSLRNRRSRGAAKDMTQDDFIGLMMDGSCFKNLRVLNWTSENGLSQLTFGLLFSNRETKAIQHEYTALPIIPKGRAGCNDAAV